MSRPTDTDILMMRRAIRLARRGIGGTHPNPRVGAVVASGRDIVGEGWHERPGLPHAEVIALQRAGNRAKGSSLYVTLEPCAAHGRTPPCTQAIRAAGITEVVFASSDPHPTMGGGADDLRAAGVAVQAGVLQAEADELNAPFFKHVRTGLPYVTAKAAISLDGKVATRGGHSQWISNERSRRHAHRLRATQDAIIVGAGTFMRDNPALTVRLARSRGVAPLRVVLSRDTPPFDAGFQLADGLAPSRLYVRQHNAHSDAWMCAGVEVVQSGDVEATLRHLAADGRLSVMVEGGGRTLAAFFEARLVDGLVLYQAPMLFGGEDAKGLWQGIGVELIAQAPRLSWTRRRLLDQDQVIQGRIVYPNS